MVLQKAKHEAQNGGGPNLDLLFDLIERYFTQEDLRDFERFKTIVWMEGLGGKKFVEDSHLIEFIVGYLAYTGKVDQDLFDGVDKERCSATIGRFKEKAESLDETVLHPGCAKEVFGRIIGEIEEIDAENGKRIVRNACSKFADIEVYTILRHADRLC